jgi:hypothetical protein
MFSRLETLVTMRDLYEGLVFLRGWMPTRLDSLIGKVYDDAKIEGAGYGPRQR